MNSAHGSVISRKRLALSVGALAAAMAMGPGSAMATSTTSTMTVDATVNNVCIVDATSSLHFGSLDAIAGTSTSPTGNTKPGSGAVNYSCTNGSSPTVYLSAATSTLAGTKTGTGNDAITATYYEADYSTAFPTAAPGDTLTGDGATHAVTIYGKVATGVLTLADTYTGTVTVNVAY